MSFQKNAKNGRLHVQYEDRTSIQSRDLETQRLVRIYSDVCHLDSLFKKKKLKKKRISTERE